MEEDCTPEVKELIEDADSGEIAQALYDGLKEAIRDQLGYVVVDMTTDDDDGEYRLCLVPE